MRYESFWKDLIRVLDFPNLMLNFMINLVMQFKNFIYYEIRKMSITKTYTEKSEVTTKPCHISQKSFIWKPYVFARPHTNEDISEISIYSYNS